MCHWSHLLPRSLQIQRQQSPQDRLVVGVERILPPTVGGPDGAVEGLVGLVESRLIERRRALQRLPGEAGTISRLHDG